METAFKTETLQLEWLHCVDCAATSEKTVAKRAGVNEVKATFGSGKLKVNYNPVKISLQELINCVEKIGYRVITSAHKNITKRILWKQSEFVFMVISGILLGFGLLARVFFTDPIILNLNFYYPITLSVLLFLASTFIGAYHFAKEGWFTIKNLNYSIGLLMLIAIIGAVVIGEHF